MGALITQRLATSGRNYASMIVSNNSSGAGSTSRLHKFLVAKKIVNSPSDFFFGYLGGNRNTTGEFNQFYMNFGARV